MTPYVDGREVSRSADLALWMGQNAPVLRRYFRKRVSASEADEMVQDVFIAMIEQMNHAPLEIAQRHLFIITAQRLARRRAESTELSFDKFVAVADDFSMERFVVRRGEFVLIDPEIRERSPSARRAFILHRFKNITYKGLGQKLDVVIGVVRKSVARALAISS